MTPRARWPTLAALAVFALGGWETSRALWAERAAPIDGDWAAAAAWVRARHQPGDLVLFAPDWIDPVGRLHLGDLLDAAAVGRPSAERYGRLLQVAARGARHPDVVGAAELEAASFGALRAARYQRPAPRLSFDAADAFAGAEVDLIDAAPEPLACPRNPDGRALCPGGIAALVQVAEVDYRPRRCIVTTPPTVGHTRVRFARVELPEGARVVLYAGRHDFNARFRDGRAVGVELLVDRRPTDRLTVGIEGWVAHRVEWSHLGVEPGLHDLALELGPAGEADLGGRPTRDLQVCLTAEVLR